MIIGVPKEIMHDEARVAASPEAVKQYVADGHTVLFERELAKAQHITTRTIRQLVLS